MLSGRSGGRRARPGRRAIRCFASITRGLAGICELNASRRPASPARAPPRIIWRLSSNGRSSKAELAPEMTGPSLTAHDDHTAIPLVEGSSCLVVAPVDRATVLIDAESYYGAFVQAALAARRYIYITGWQFDTRARLLRPAPGATPK